MLDCLGHWFSLYARFNWVGKFHPIKSIDTKMLISIPNSCFKIVVANRKNTLLDLKGYDDIVMKSKPK